MKEDKKLLDVVKSSLEVLEGDISFLREFDISLPSDISNFQERMNSRYASAIEKIVREDKSGYSDLEDILVGVNETRLQQYQKASKSMLQTTREELKSAFWFRSQFSLSKRIDDIENRILDIDYSSKDPSKIEKSIKQYRSQINALGNIQDRFRGERYRSRINISLRAILWFSPILIGIVFGMYLKDGKINFTIVFVLIGIMILLALLSYLFVGNKQFGEILYQNKVVLIISLFVLIVAILLWQFYTSISSYFNINFEDIFLILASILVGILGITTIFLKEIPEALVKRNFVVVIPTIDKNFSPEDKILIPYSLENKRSGVITEVGVSIFAPGLFVFLEGRDILYMSMSGKSTENGKLKLLVPKEAVSGEYTVELEWSFYVGSKMYEKTNKIKVNVVS